MKSPGHLLFAVVDEHDEPVGGAPYDGPSEAVVRAEVEATLGMSLPVNWRIVPLTPALERRLREIGKETIR